MAKNDNIQDLLKDVADAIRTKKGSEDLINPQDFSSEIESIKTSMWTGHADVEGLKAIGWDDDDITYFQEHGVDWDEEYDDYFKVSDDNKALYGVLTADNISEYKDRIVYLPKIDTSAKFSFSNFLHQCYALYAIPMIDVSNATTTYGIFQNCSSLRHVPNLNYIKSKSGDAMFSGSGLSGYFVFDAQNITSLNQTFRECKNLRAIKMENSDNVTNMGMLFYNSTYLCYVLFDASKSSNLGNAFYGCMSLASVFIRNLKVNISFTSSPLISKESLVYIINNEAATSAIMITLHAYAYSHLAEDADIVEALSNHPLVTLASE